MNRFGANIRTKIFYAFSIVGVVFLTNSLFPKEVSAMCCDMFGCEPCDSSGGGFDQPDQPGICVGNSCDCELGAACHDGDGSVSGNSGCYNDWYPMIGARIYYDANNNGTFERTDLLRIGGGTTQSEPPPVYINTGITTDCYVETSYIPGQCNRSSDDYYTRPSWYNPLPGACQKIIDNLRVDLNYKYCRGAYNDGTTRRYTNCDTDYTHHIENYPDSCYTRFPAFNQGYIDWDGGMISGYVQPLTVFTQTYDDGAFFPLTNTMYDIDVFVVDADTAGYEVRNKEYCVNGVCTPEQAWGCPWTVIDLLIGDDQEECLVSASATASINEGGTGTLTVSNNSSDVNDIRLNYITPNDGVISIQGLTGNYTPITGTNTYQINAGQVPANQTYSITVRGRTPDGTTCDATTNNLVVQDTTTYSPWWRVVNSTDVTTASGSNPAIQSNLPTAGTRFNNPIQQSLTNGTLPGLTLMGAGGVASMGAAGSQVSQPNWNAKTSVSAAEVPTYASLYEKAPQEMKDATAFTGSNMNENQMLSSGWLDANGYRWIRTTGDLELSNSGGIDLASNKVILFVNGNLTFNSNMTRLNVTNASGFLMVVANGNITVSGATAFIDGIYVGNNFSTGNSSTQFSVYGSVIANGTINLQRDLLASNQTTAAETFNYIPAFLLRIPSDFNQRIIRWREVAPGNL